LEGCLLQIHFKAIQPGVTYPATCKFLSRFQQRLYFLLLQTQPLEEPQFKAQPMTSQGQFDRYFGTSEMDPFFGSSSRGAGAPKTAEEMMALATQQKAPMETPLSTYYRSQSAAGRAEMPAITEGLGYAKGTPLAQWAEANPMLAKRLFEKTKAKKAAGTEEDAYAHPRDLGAGAQAEQGYTLAAYGIK
jgi:hypothetical protein